MTSLIRGVTMNSKIAFHQLYVIVFVLLVQIACGPSDSNKISDPDSTQINPYTKYDHNKGDASADALVLDFEFTASIHLPSTQ